jgi:hypothetical protein
MVLSGATTKALRIKGSPVEDTISSWVITVCSSTMAWNVLPYEESMSKAHIVDVRIKVAKRTRPML